MVCEMIGVESRQPGAPVTYKFHLPGIPVESGVKYHARKIGYQRVKLPAFFGQRPFDDPVFFIQCQMHLSQA